MSHILEDFQRFLDTSPTSWHAVQEIGNRLSSIDFTPLEEREKWELEPGKKYFVQRGGSLCAFSLPKTRPSKGVIIASHTDSPALKLKPNAEVSQENMLLLETEVYGAPLLSSWLNRDLAIAGRIVVQNKEGEVEEKLVFLNEAPLFIPQLAVHLDREVNEKGLILNKQEHLRPILTLNTNTTLESLFKKQHAYHLLLGFDLFLVPLQTAKYVGAEGEMIASYRLDNLSSAHACTAAIASAKTDNTLQLALFWDNEEVGSRTAEGAASPLLSDTLKRIGLGLGFSEEDSIRLRANTFCISVDVAHAYNPNFPKKYDPKHLPHIGKGIILKYNADKKYASDAKTAAPIIQACKRLKLPYQSYACRSDIPCGSTVGPIVAQGLGIPTVDIGCPIFSMHSAREVMACQDHLDLCQLLTELLA
jgi:aspartyl aminopeptidase